MSHLSTYICSFIFIVFHHMMKKEIKKNVHLLSTFSKGSVLTSPRPTSSHALPSNILPPPPTSPSIHCPPPSVLPLLAHRLSGVNHSISISPQGKSPLLLLTSSGINAGCQRRVGDSELPRVDSQVAWERIQRGRSTIHYLH